MCFCTVKKNLWNNKQRSCTTDKSHKGKTRLFRGRDGNAGFWRIRELVRLAAQLSLPAAEVIKLQRVLGPFRDLFTRLKNYLCKQGKEPSSTIAYDNFLGYRLLSGFMLFCFPRTSHWLPNFGMCESHLSNSSALTPHILIQTLGWSPGIRSPSQRL